MKNYWSGKRVLIIGAARQGLALARYLAGQDARVTLSDANPAEKMAQAQSALADYPVTWALGGHPLELLDGTDVVCVSGGVPLDLPILVEAAGRGLPLTNDSQIFMDAVPCPVIGITGSAGKTTTTTLVGRIAQAATRAPRSAWVGGNIGTPLIDRLEEIKAQDVVILELSSFQLELMTRSPHIAAVLNITPNHLDRHGTMQAYSAAKARILEYQSHDDAAVLGRGDAGAWAMKQRVKGRLVSFGLEPLGQGQAGTFVEDESIYYSDGSTKQALFPEEIILLRGNHNRLNVLAACAISLTAGFAPEALCIGVEGFSGVPHRLELVGEWHGVRWYNDSIATAPERTLAAIRSFSEPLVLMLGGRDKNLPWDELAEVVHQRVDHVVIFGEAAEKISHALGPVQPGRLPYSQTVCADVQSAVEAAAAAAQAGSVVLFSPGGTSFDEFKDFEERGERFSIWVKALS